MKKFVLPFLLSLNLLALTTKAQLILPNFSPAKVVEELSTNNDESTPLFYNDGTGVYFSRTYFKGKGENQEVDGQEIFFSEKKGLVWNKPLRLFRREVISGENSLVGTSKDGNRLYLLNTLATEKNATRKLVYIDQTSKDVWSTPVEIKIPGLVFGEKYANFFITPNGKICLISISISNKILNEDLFVSLKDKNGNWGNMINLGKTINTNRFEVYPYTTNEGKNLYFSSDGHGGYGMSDLFVSHRLGDSWTKWTKPLNIGEPFNSGEYDASFSMASGKDVYFTSTRNKKHNNIYFTEATGGFTYANSVQGTFMLKGIAAKNKKLRVEDEDGNLIEEIFTDENGLFKFLKLTSEENFLLKLAEEDSDLFEGSKIYFVDGNGEKTARYILTKDGMFVNSKDLKAETEIQGMFSYNNLPSIKAGLIIIDENGFPLDTIFTDEKGNFNYSFLVYDDQFSFLPLNMTNDEYRNVDLYLTDRNGNKLKSLVPAQLHKIPNSLVAFEDRDSKRTTGIDAEMINGADSEIAAFNKMTVGGRIIYFDFSSLVPSKAEMSKLSNPISILKLDPTRIIILTGYTDNVGTSAFNESYSLKRAMIIHDYLISKGIGAKSIKVIAMGENNPAQSNDTTEGKKKNRRVTVDIK